MSVTKKNKNIKMNKQKAKAEFYMKLICHMLLRFNRFFLRSWRRKNTKNEHTDITIILFGNSKSEKTNKQTNKNHLRSFDYEPKIFKEVFWLTRKIELLNSIILIYFMCLFYYFNLQTIQQSSKRVILYEVQIVLL